MNQKLDNPVWYSLAETQAHAAISYDGVKCYHPHFCPFGGYIHAGKTAEAIDEYAKLVSDFYIVGNRPQFSAGVYLSKELVCNQMLLENLIDVSLTDPITTLTPAHADELYNLVNLVQPGYFKRSTYQLGAYYGIFKNNELVAVTGERMKMDGFTEISAVVTHPSHTGKGYAKQLVAHTAQAIFTQNRIPYLHVAETNTGAISLYEKLGFKTRRKISFWNFKLTADR